MQGLLPGTVIKTPRSLPLREQLLSWEEHEQSHDAAVYRVGQPAPWKCRAGDEVREISVSHTATS